MIPGGVHSGGLTHNALVPFPDGTYLELLSTTRPAKLKLLFLLKRLRLIRFYIGNETAINRRLITDLASGIGMADFCLSSGDLEKDISRIEARGERLSRLIPGGRVRPDGKEIAWQTSVPRTLDLPFLIEDVTARELRLPVVGEKYHKNGILGIGGLIILVSNLVESMSRYRALLGDDPISQAQYPQPGTQSSEFRSAQYFLTLLTPLPGHSALRKPLNHRPSRPVGIFFRAVENGSRDPLCLTYLPERGATLSRSKILFRE